MQWISPQKVTISAFFNSASLIMAFISLAQKLSATSPSYYVKVVLKFIHFPISSPFSSTEELIKKICLGKMKFRSLQSEDLVLIHYINHPLWGFQLHSSRELHRGCYAFSFSKYYRTSWNSLTTKEPARNAFAMLLCCWKCCQSAGEKIQFIADDDGLEKNFIDCACFFTKNVIVCTIGYTVTLKA